MAGKEEGFFRRVYRLGRQQTAKVLQDLPAEVGDEIGEYLNDLSQGGEREVRAREMMDLIMGSLDVSKEWEIRLFVRDYMPDLSPELQEEFIQGILKRKQ